LVSVFLFSGLTPTPFIPFSVQKKSAAIGIVITASHNPKDDNGYKVYWSNGPQVRKTKFIPTNKVEFFTCSK
jgi:phosphoglucomutase/phosphopentomutase